MVFLKGFWELKILIILLIIDAIVSLIASVVYICIKKSTKKMVDDFVKEMKMKEK